MNLIEAFNFVKYEFVFLTVISIGIFICVIFFKKFFNTFSVYVISFICTIISMLNLILLGYAADELNTVDITNTYLFIAVIVFSIINSIFAYRNRQHH
ncbi:hypothetical protein K0H71_08070 [Bacillus sp. IITD106]|nr:hypothetical protein [Bacillus sp. IITD106]